MAYKDAERQREYQRRWASAKRQQKHNEMISTATTETTQQTGLGKPFIAQLEEQLAAAEAEADRLEANRLAAIKAETAHLQQLTGDDGGR